MILLQPGWRGQRGGAQLGRGGGPAQPQRAEHSRNKETIDLSMLLLLTKDSSTQHKNELNLSILAK